MERDNCSGASLVFVLAAMLLLMAIGVSAMTAAGANTAADINRHGSIQLELYAQSMHRTLMHSLQSASDDIGSFVSGNPSLDSPETLGGRMLGLIYNKAQHSQPSVAFNAQISPPLLAGNELNAITGVSIDVTASTIITEAIPAQAAVPGVSPGEARRPQTAAINASVEVIVTVVHLDKSLTTAVSYDFSGGFLEDDGHDADNMMISDAGTWEFVSYEKIE